MRRRLVPAACLSALLGVAAPANADDRTVTIGAVERIRVLGPYEVIVAATRSPAVTLSGDDAAIQAVDVSLDGGTLTLRGRIGERTAPLRAAPPRPVVIHVGSDALTGATLVGGGRLTVARMAAPRVDVAVTGAGAIAVGEVRADTTVATVIGAGAMTLAGRSGTARLLANGTGTIDADALDGGDLLARLEGPGTITARARFTAQVINTGLGRVTVAGNPKCRVTAPAGGPVACGAGTPAR